MIAPKLKRGDTICVVAPARSASILSKETREIAYSRFKELGLRLVFGKYIEEVDFMNSATVEERVADLEKAFLNDEIAAILTVIGGFNTNQLLSHINWDIIKKNPKIFCGFSIITDLANAIYAKTGLVTYSGPHYSSFGQKHGFDYTLKYFKKCLMSEDKFQVKTSTTWADDKWYLDQENYNPVENKGYYVINPGIATGTILGGNMTAFTLIQGTDNIAEYSENTLLFLEDDFESSIAHFDMNLQSLILREDFENVNGLVIGRFQKESSISDSDLEKVIKNKSELDNIPVIANANLGHATPIFTFPIGGTASIEAKNKQCKIEILKH